MRGVRGRPSPNSPEGQVPQHIPRPSCGSAPTRATRRGWRPTAASESLLEAVRSDPEGQLGAAVCKRFGDALPFLMKVLAADEPLSLQAHPSAKQAAEGFAREERLRHSGVVADPQLPRPQPQTGAAGGAGHLRGACGFPACARNRWNCCGRLRFPTSIRSSTCWPASRTPTACARCSPHGSPHRNRISTCWCPP